MVSICELLYSGLLLRCCRDLLPHALAVELLLKLLLCLVLNQVHMLQLDLSFHPGNLLLHLRTLTCYLEKSGSL